MGEGISAQFDGLTTWQLMDHTLVYYHIANMDKLLNLLTERHAMMILSLTSLTQREYEDVVMMFVANPDISMDRNEWHQHWGLPSPNDEAGKAGFWKQVLTQVEEYVQRTNAKPLSLSLNLTELVFDTEEIPGKPGYVHGWKTTRQMTRVSRDELQWSHDPSHWTKRPDPPPGSGPPTPPDGWDAEHARLMEEERLRLQREHIQSIADAYNGKTPDEHALEVERRIQEERQLQHGERGELSQQQQQFLNNVRSLGEA